MTQVRLDTQHRGAVEDLGAVTHTRSAQDQEPGDLGEQRATGGQGQGLLGSKTYAQLDWRLFNVVINSYTLILKPRT